MSLIRLVLMCKSCSAVLHHVPPIINMHYGDTWQKAISKAISFPKQGLWGVHFKCPPTTKSELHLERENYVIEKKKTFQTCHQLKGRRQQQKYKMSQMRDSPSSVCSISVHHGSIIPFNWRDCAALGNSDGGLEKGLATLAPLVEVLWILLLIWSLI